MNPTSSRIDRKLLIPNLFPDPRQADESGVLCIGGELNLITLINAYYRGIFPWPHEGYPLLWFSPIERGVLDFNDLHISRSLHRSMKKLSLRFSFNEEFEAVMDYCAKVPRRGQKGTWLTQKMRTAYAQLFRAGYALSIEAWQGRELVGGLYGVFIEGVFSGESMFGLKPDVSKICLVKLVEHLKGQGLEWMDIQMTTPVTESLGGKLIPRAEYLERIEKVHKRF